MKTSSNGLRDNIRGITSLFRRGGVKRISGLTYKETRGALKVFPENVIRDAITALKRQERTLYGFGGHEALAKRLTQHI
ncbi:unnamed protein product [Heligmosomoides polygyrus]|uniref:Histone H4 n=1 Tax=Heligmosomoides polygyrus TaxID=6339 RepID=A0A3P8BSX4_HELPZ|nr:unnamed protein product [Heligmosomoides polygyrus]